MASIIRSMTRGAIAAVAERLAATSKEASRALPDSKGGETPKQLQSHVTQIYTYFTRATGDTSLLYSADRWVKIKLTLETAGPVAIGTAATLEPVLSGRGRLLDTDEEYETYLPKGARIHIISETVNRVAVTIEPVPWLEQISNQQNESQGAVVAAITRASQAIVDAVKAIAPSQVSAAAPAASSQGTTAAQLPPCPPPAVINRARLTPIRGPGRLR